MDTSFNLGYLEYQGPIKIEHSQDKLSTLPREQKVFASSKPQLQKILDLMLLAKWHRKQVVLLKKPIGIAFDLFPLPSRHSPRNAVLNLPYEEVQFFPPHGSRVCFERADNKLVVVVAHCKNYLSLSYCLVLLSSVLVALIQSIHLGEMKSSGFTPQTVLQHSRVLSLHQPIQGVQGVVSIQAMKRFIVLPPQFIAACEERSKLLSAGRGKECENSDPWKQCCFDASGDEAGLHELLQPLEFPQGLQEARNLESRD
ncbi:hypothetical protein BTVI_60805 [Pitangus sulphuratus]|nr:hypothetical protein BTVI_60805 [Pitangus sulphuratus]